MCVPPFLQLKYGKDSDPLMNNCSNAVSPLPHCILSGSHHHATPQQQPILLFFLLASAASKPRDLRLECSWLDDSTGLDWSRLPFMDVFVVALELVLAREAIAAAVLAPKHRARVLEFLRAGTVLYRVVAYEIGPSFAAERINLLHAAECCIARFLEMVSFV